MSLLQFIAIHRTSPMVVIYARSSTTFFQVLSQVHALLLVLNLSTQVIMPDSNMFLSGTCANNPLILTSLQPKKLLSQLDHDDWQHDWQTTSHHDPLSQLSSGPQIEDFNKPDSTFGPQSVWPGLTKLSSGRNWDNFNWLLATCHGAQNLPDLF